MNKTTLAVSMAFIEELLGDAANAAWDAIWDKIFDLVVMAEEKWKQSGLGAVKRDEVLKGFLAWAKSIVSLSRTQEILLTYIVGRAIDLFIFEVNRIMGQGWIEKVKAMENRLSILLPVIE